MLGEHGEVQVLDWGLAMVLDPQSVITDSQPDKTAFVVGTPAYMAPEQVGSANVDKRVDVYALGVILYELLTLRLPLTGKTSREMLLALLVQKPRLPHEVAPSREIPAQLEDLCMRALSKDPDERQRDASEILNTVQAWLEEEADRARRHALAAEKVEKGRERLREHRELRSEMARLESEVEALGKQFKTWQPVEEKTPFYQAEDHCTAVRRQLTEVGSEVLTVLTEALGFERENRNALELLADYYWDCFREAELRGDSEAAAFYLKLVATYHCGKYARQLAGDGTLSLQSEPAGAEAFLYRFEEEKLILHPVPVGPLGRTPLQGKPLPMGSYLVVLRKEGYEDVRYPIYISRNRDWVGSVRLYSSRVLGKGFRYVPPGPFIEGGDPQSYWSVPRREPVVDGFFIGETPITVAEYVEFLEDQAQRDLDAAVRRCPRRTPEGGPYLEVTADRRFVLPPDQKEARDFMADPRYPLCGISWNDAMAYCEWRSRRDGRTYRLPTATEWEKAARGVDGRFFPWGNRFDASLCNIRESRSVRASIVSVDEFPTDVSVYGVRGMSGNVRDWTCTEHWEGEGAQARPYYVVRGGAWYGGRISARVADRYWFEPAHVYFFVGFRLAHTPRGAAA